MSLKPHKTIKHLTDKLKVICAKSAYALNVCAKGFTKIIYFNI